LTFIGYYNKKFSKNYEFYFNTNTLNNAITYILETYNLEEGGDT